MTTSIGFLIRDGLEADVAACLALDHTYETSTVWQTQIRGEPGAWQIALHEDRLPRTMTVDYPLNVARLRAVLGEDECFLVACTREDNAPLGYLTMQRGAHGIAHVRDVVVAPAFRRKHVALRLLRVARVWAQERGFTRLHAETQTKNTPAIALLARGGYTFCGFNDQYFTNGDIAVFFCHALR